jgi:hypothetical protein
MPVVPATQEGEESRRISSQSGQKVVGDPVSKTKQKQKGLGHGSSNRALDLPGQGLCSIPSNKNPPPQKKKQKTKKQRPTS